MSVEHSRDDEETAGAGAHTAGEYAMHRCHDVGENDVEVIGDVVDGRDARSNAIGDIVALGIDDRGGNGARLDIDRLDPCCAQVLAKLKPKTAAKSNFPICVLLREGGNRTRWPRVGMQLAGAEASSFHSAENSRCPGP